MADDALDALIYAHTPPQPVPDLTGDKPITLEWLKRAYDKVLPARPGPEPGRTYVEILRGTGRHGSPRRAPVTDQPDGLFPGAPEAPLTPQHVADIARLNELYEAGDRLVDAAREHSDTALRDAVSHWQNLRGLPAPDQPADAPGAVTITEIGFDPHVIEVDTGYPWRGYAHSGTVTITLAGDRPAGHVEISATCNGDHAEARAGWQALTRLLEAQPPSRPGRRGRISEQWSWHEPLNGDGEWRMDGHTAEL